MKDVLPDAYMSYNTMHLVCFVPCCTAVSPICLLDATFFFCRDCPEDCREAVSSLMFAAARFADLPELRELRGLFTERYGKSVEHFANKEVIVHD